MDREEAIKVYHELLNERIKEAFEFFAPELKESEDEMVRKEIVEFLKLIDNGTAKVHVWTNTKKWISWLERQKEQPSTADDIAKTAYQLGLADGRKEQKPADIAPNQFDGITYGMSGHSTEKPAEWSEKDEKNIEKLDGFLSGVFRYGPIYLTQKDKEELQSWLKSLGPQPKQEWVEEDEKKLSAVISLMKSNRAVDPLYDKMSLEGWLKSLRSRPKPSDNWKPSEEQMKALEASYSVLKAHDTWSEDEHLPVLRSLIDNFQKLL